MTSTIRKHNRRAMIRIGLNDAGLALAAVLTRVRDHDVLDAPELRRIAAELEKLAHLADTPDASTPTTPAKALRPSAALRLVK